MQAGQQARAREQHRQAGRAVLRTPGNWVAHEAHVTAASALDGMEPLQGALVDLLYACQPAPARMAQLLQRPPIAERLTPFVAQTFAMLVQRGRGLPRVTPLATRYCVLATPSLDVPARALLCGVDDSREIATAAIPFLMLGDMGVEDAFLSHCEGARDTLAFMLARRALTREGFVLSDRWNALALALEQGGSA